MRWRVKRGEVYAAIVGSLASVVAIVLFGSGGGDDSHITWWVVDELVRTGRISNLNHQPLEQSSSLALVVIAAALRAVLPFSTPALGVVLSLLFSVATAWMSARVAKRFDPRLQIPAAALIATSAPLAYWSTSGMESSLAAFAGVWLMDALLIRAGAPDEKTWASLPNVVGAVLLYVTVRPENPLLIFAFFALAGAAHVTTQGFRMRRGIADLGTGVVTAAGGVSALFLYRHFTFHEWFPHPVTAKMGGSAHWAEGARYLLAHALPWSPTLLVTVPIALLASVWLWTRERLELPLALVFAQAVCTLLFVLGSGGDWMGAGRFLVPAIPSWWLLTLAVFTTAVPGRARYLIGIAAVLVTVNMATLYKLAISKDANGYPLAAARRAVPAARTQYALASYSFLELANKSHLRDALAAEALKGIVGRALARSKAPLWIASGQAGAIPYHVFQAFPERLRFLDFWGLATDEINPCLDRRVKHTRLGLSISLPMLFENPLRNERRCGVPTPDIIFNNSLRASTKKQLEGYGYTVVYFQKGAMRSFEAPDSEFVGGTRIDTYIAVRNEIVEALHLSYREVSWGIAG